MLVSQKVEVVEETEYFYHGMEVVVGHTVSENEASDGHHALLSDLPCRSVSLWIYTLFGSALAISAVSQRCLSNFSAF